MEYEQTVDVNIDDIPQVSHVDKKKIYFKNYYQMNKEKIYKKYYADHKDEVIQRAKQSRNKIITEDTERYKQMKKEWNKKAYQTKKQKLLDSEN